MSVKREQLFLDLARNNVLWSGLGTLIYLEFVKRVSEKQCKGVGLGEDKLNSPFLQKWTIVIG